MGYERAVVSGVCRRIGPWSGVYCTLQSDLLPWSAKRACACGIAAKLTSCAHVATHIPMPCACVAPAAVHSCSRCTDAGPLQPSTRTMYDKWRVSAWAGSSRGKPELAQAAPAVMGAGRCAWLDAWLAYSRTEAQIFRVCIHFCDPQYAA